MSKDETLKRYYTVIGRIPPNYAEQLKYYDISNPESEKLLVYCKWEDYRQKNSYHNCIAKNSDYYLSVENKYSFEDLKKAIKNFTSSNDYSYHKKDE